MIIAHRGFGKNRIQDFKESIKETQAVELDLRLTKDKRIIIYHDSNFYALTGYNKDVKKMNYNEIKKIPYFVEHPKDLPPLFITDFIPMAKEFNLIDVEIKPSSYHWIDYWLYKKAFILLKKETKAEIIISSFDADLLDWMIKNLNQNDFKIGYIFFNIFTLNDEVKNNCDYLIPKFSLLTGEKHKKWFLKQKQKIFPWTINEQDEIDQIKTLYPENKIKGWITNKMLNE